MTRIWSLAAAISVIAAFIFFWFHNFDGVFVAAVLGSVAWLLHYRAETKQRVAVSEPDENVDNS